MGMQRLRRSETVRAQQVITMEAFDYSFLRISCVTFLFAFPVTILHIIVVSLAFFRITVLRECLSAIHIRVFICFNRSDEWIHSLRRSSFSSLSRSLFVAKLFARPSSPHCSSHYLVYLWLKTF